MHFILTIASLLTASVAQQTTQIPIIMAGAEPFTLSDVRGSIVNANAMATTVALECQGDECAYSRPITVTEGPSTWYASAIISSKDNDLDARVTRLEDCNIIDETKSAVCHLSQSIDVNVMGVTSSRTLYDTTTTFPGDQITYQTLTVTGGVQKLKQVEPTRTPNAASAHHAGAGAMALGIVAAVMGFL